VSKLSGVPFAGTYSLSGGRLGLRSSPLQGWTRLALATYAREAVRGHAVTLWGTLDARASDVAASLLSIAAIVPVRQRTAAGH